MSFDAATIDAIVREVVRRLPAMPHGPREASPERIATPPPAVEPVHEPIGTALRLTDRVITWAAVEPKLQHAKTLIIPAQAVVTPLTRDELAARGVMIRRQSANLPIADRSAAPTPSVATGPTWYLAIDQDVARARPGQVEAVERALRSRSDREGLADFERLDADTPGNLASRLAGLAADASGSSSGAERMVWLTDRVATAVMVANRHASLRATWATEATDPAYPSDPFAEIDANTLVVAPGRRGTYALVSMIERFLRPRS